MSKPFGQLRLPFAVVLLILAAGCSSGKKDPTNPSGLHFVTPSSSPTIDGGQSITVTVSGSDTSNVSWTLEVGFGNPKGTLSNKSGGSATYTGPSNITAETQVTIVATSGTDSAALAVFVMPPPQPPTWSTSGPTSCPPNGTVILPGGSPLSSQVGQTLTSGPNFGLKVTGGVVPYTWSVASGSLPSGLTTQVGTDTSQLSIVGTPTASDCSSFTVKVTDAVGVSATSATLYMIVIPPSLKVAMPILRNSLIDPSNNGVSYVPAEMLSSGGMPPYAWSIAGAGQNGLPPGLSMAKTGVITGVPNASGLPQNSFDFYQPSFLVSDGQLPYPATANPGPKMVVVPQDPSCPTGQESFLKAGGFYAFQLHGFDANGPVSISGNFVVDGSGVITGGTEDISRTTGAPTSLTIGTGSTYTLRNNRGCVTLVTSAGTTPFRIAMGGCSNGRDDQGKDCQTGSPFYFTSGHMVEFDDSTGSGTRVSGIVRLQDPSTFQNSGIQGMYAFGLSGWDMSKGRFAMAGSATASSGAWSSVAADTNDAGTLGTALVGGSGTFNINADGRGTGTVTVGSLSLNVVLYPVSSTEVLIATVGPPSAVNPMLTGEAIGITTTPGAFTTQSLENSHIFHIAGVSKQGPDPSIGTIAFDGAGGFTGIEYENQAGTLSASNLSGGYSMDGTTGRFAFSATGTQNVGHPLVGYVIPAPSTLSFPACIVRAACITGFLLSTDATAQAGVLEFQTPPNGPPPPFSINNLLGDYVFGSDEPLDSKTVQFNGAGNAGGGSVAVVQDTSNGDPKYCLLSSCTILVPDDQASLSVAVNADGSGQFGGQTVSVTNSATTFYIDESPLNLHPSIVVVEQ